MLHKVEVVVGVVFSQTTCCLLTTAPQGIDGDVCPLGIGFHQGINQTDTDQPRCPGDEEALAVQASHILRLADPFQILLIQRMLFVKSSYFSHVSLSIFI